MIDSFCISLCEMKQKNQDSLFWPILYVSLIIFFKSNGLSVFKSKNSPARTVKSFLLLCTADSRDMGNPSTCTAKLSGISKEKGGRKKSTQTSFFLCWAFFGQLQTYWNQMSDHVVQMN